MAGSSIQVYSCELNQHAGQLRFGGMESEPLDMPGPVSLPQPYDTNTPRFLRVQSPCYGGFLGQLMFDDI